MKTLVIFDLDGTLLNTIKDLGESANYALRKNGFPERALSSYPFFVGNGVSRLLERVLPDDQRNQANVEILRKSFIEYYSEHLAVHTTPYPGIHELLDELQCRGIKLAVASNKYQEAVDVLIRHFFPNIHWAAIEGQKEGVPVKPDPSIVFEILSKTPTPKSEVLYVGDSGVDMETARRACVDSVGVTWGFRPLKELREYHANTIVNSPEEIVGLLSGIPV